VVGCQDIVSTVINLWISIRAGYFLNMRASNNLSKIILPNWCYHINIIIVVWPPIHWVPGLFHPGVKAGGRKVGHFYVVPRSRITDLYLHFPIRLHGVVLDLLGTGTNLSYHIIFSRMRVLRDEYNGLWIG
jgi:hypothetical protein